MGYTTAEKWSPRLRFNHAHCRYRFPDRAWWARRTVPDHIPQYRIDRHPSDIAEYGSTAETVIPHLVQRIVKRFNPIAVVLFGSMARGDCNIHSDVDLMVIMPDGTDRRDTALGILKEVARSPLPKDVLVSTPKIWADRVEDAGTVQRAIDSHGVVLYG